VTIIDKRRLKKKKDYKRPEETQKTRGNYEDTTNDQRRLSKT
jgi:hypothetical protein